MNQTADDSTGKQRRAPRAASARTKGIRVVERVGGAKSYEVRVRTGDLERMRTFRTVKDAERWQRDQLAALDRGQWLDPRAGRITLGAFASTWLDSAVELRGTSRSAHERNLRLHILPTLGKVELAKLTPPMLRTWQATVSTTPKRNGKPRSAATTRQAYATLHRVLAVATRDGAISRNPLGAVDQLKPVKREQTIVTADEVAAIVQAFDPRYQCLVLVATYCGLRAGELVGLRRHRVDLVKRRIEVIEQITEISGGELVQGEPKTDLSTRTVPIPAFLVPVLAEHLSVRSEAGTTGLVFPAAKGGPIRWRSWVGRYWRPVVDPMGYIGLRFHDLRHTFASLAIEAGADVKTLQTVLGHASAAMTLDVYSGMFPNRLDSLGEKLDDIGRNAKVKPPATVTPIQKAAGE